MLSAQIHYFFSLCNFHSMWLDFQIGWNPTSTRNAHRALTYMKNLTGVSDRHNSLSLADTSPDIPIRSTNKNSLRFLNRSDVCQCHLSPNRNKNWSAQTKWEDFENPIVHCIQPTVSLLPSSEKCPISWGPILSKDQWSNIYIRIHIQKSKGNAWDASSLA